MSLTLLEMAVIGMNPTQATVVSMTQQISLPRKLAALASPEQTAQTMLKATLTPQGMIAHGTMRTQALADTTIPKLSEQMTCAALATVAVFSRTHSGELTSTTLKPMFMVKHSINNTRTLAEE
jgi:hypothetical protein